MHVTHHGVHLERSQALAMMRTWTRGGEEPDVRPHRLEGYAHGGGKQRDPIQHFLNISQGGLRNRVQLTERQDRPKRLLMVSIKISQGNETIRGRIRCGFAFGKMENQYNTIFERQEVSRLIWEDTATRRRPCRSPGPRRTSTPSILREIQPE